MGVLWVDLVGTGTANLLTWEGSVVAFWCPAWRVTLWHLAAVSYGFPFLTFQISKELVIPHESWNSGDTTPILTQAKSGLNWRALLALRVSRGGFHSRTGWCTGGGPSHRWAQLGNKYTISVWGKQNGPCTPRILNTDLLLSCREHQKQHHVPYSLAILLNGTFLLIHRIASMLWAFQYVF